MSLVVNAMIGITTPFYYNDVMIRFFIHFFFCCSKNIVHGQYHEIHSVDMMKYINIFMKLQRLNKNTKHFLVIEFST